MSRNYYSEIHLHCVWHTKESMPLLTPRVEAVAHQYLRGKIINTPGVYIHEIGGTETHIHILISIAPTVLISELIGKLKGSSSHEVNQKLGGGSKVVEWQSGYGVVSLGTKNIPWTRAYILNQRRHHARGTVEERLERITSEEDEAQAEQREAP
jgi:putative transposase